MPRRRLEARGLRMRFASGGEARSDALALGELVLEGGELLVLAGRNGSGKTVLAKILSGLYQPSEGRVLVDGVSLTDQPGGPAGAVGYVFQDARVQALGERVLDDCCFGPMNRGLPLGEATAAARRALARCGLSGREGAFVHTLSGGELRRLAVAGILALDPSFVILDEPFANLDREGVRAVLSIIQDLRTEGRGIIVATHELEKVLGLADRALVLDEGKEAYAGKARGLLDLDLEALGLRHPLACPRGFEDLSWLP